MMKSCIKSEFGLSDEEFEARREIVKQESAKLVADNEKSQNTNTEDKIHYHRN